ncbi:hypothetical protein WJX75_000831 [Coccomyxa subellipsoidea]|uniref:Ig-like domain-containing protein n=1 Tax=Coccomyxa subellipsoidea TaxID=248742 RepID=A0ABR2YW42_9CHLO
MHPALIFCVLQWICGTSVRGAAADLGASARGRLLSGMPVQSVANLLNTTLGAVKQGLDMTAGQAEEAVDTILHVTPAPTTQPPTLTQGICNGATKLVFSGTTDAPVASQGPFSFTGWFYNDRGSLPVGYNQGIRNTNTAGFITVTNPKGIYLCQISVQGFAIIITTPSLQFSETTLWEISYVLGP